jgi:hypothetical protein
MGLMSAHWSDMSEDYVKNVCEVITITLISNRNNQRSHSSFNSQNVANIIYSFGNNTLLEYIYLFNYELLLTTIGVSGTKWIDFPPNLQNSLLNAIVSYGDQFNSQEISNILYGYNLKY